MLLIVQIFQLLIQILIFAIFIRSLLSWFPISPTGAVYQALDAVTNPILMPLRRVVPRVSTIDFTPLIAIVVLSLISRAVGSLAFA